MKRISIPLVDIPVDARDAASAHTQFGALCWRIVQRRMQVLLITSRDTGRWVIPKGWPVSGLSPERSAAQEAFEEAGVLGKPAPHCLGVYSYDKGLPPVAGLASSVPCLVAVYPLRVMQLVEQFPEAGQRRRKWFVCEKAALRVAEPELQTLLAEFSPAHVGVAGGQA